MNEYLLGIDIGTSACKIALFRKDGTVMFDTSEKYEVYYPHPGWAEQNPDEWWDAVRRAVRKLLHQYPVDPKEIKGIGIDGQSWSAVAIDREGKVLTNTPIWMDARAQAICDRLNDQIGQERIFALCKNPLQPSYTTAKILWYQENLPDVYRRIWKILQSNSFVVYRLTGVISQDLSQAYGLHFFNMETGRWNEKMCEEMGISMDFMPELVPCHKVVGTVTKEAAACTGLAAGTPVVAGGLDAACGALGAGVAQPGETQEQGGQAGGMSICLDICAADPRLILGRHVVPDKWLLQGGTTGGGGVMRWMDREFGDFERAMGKKREKSSLMQFNDLAEAVEPGSEGLIFLPYMAGERSPIWNPNAKGVFFGLDFSKTKGHMIRAAMEGVAFSLKHNLDIAEQTGAKVQELRAMGGSANSLLWTQMKADITGKPIAVPASDTATTLGAALLAGVGVGMYDSFEDAVMQTVKVSRHHQPNPENHKKYMENYETYLALYENLKELMNKTGGKNK